MIWHARLHGTGAGLDPQVWWTLEHVLLPHFRLRPFAKPSNDNRPHPTEWR